MDKSTYVVGLRFVPEPGRGLDHRIGTAQKYPWHVTIKGRFRTDETVARGLVIPCLLRLAESLESFRAELGPPEEITPTLWWRECSPGTTGHERFRSLHAWCENNIIDPEIEDQTSPRFKGLDYRPHVTVAWKEDGAILTASDQASVGLWQTTIAVEIGGLVLFRYDRDPHTDQIEALLIERHDERYPSRHR